ncbi:MAG: acyloxyacyl hydrolase [Planctomycetota bacterium]
MPPAKPLVRLYCAACVLVVAAQAAAQLSELGPSEPDPSEPLRFAHDQDEAAGDLPEAAGPRRYGLEGQRNWVFNGSVAANGEALDTGFTASFNEFIVDDIEYLLELGVWYFNEFESADSGGISGSLGFRWHFINRQKWTAFADIGIGVLFATDTVPPEGTGFNFMPRAGVGVTRELYGDTRLIAGVRWHHISNARINGEARNPARDSPLLYVGVVIPF